MTQQEVLAIIVTIMAIFGTIGLILKKKGTTHELCKLP